MMYVLDAGLHQQKVHQQEKPLIWPDSAATTHVPQCVTDAVVREAMTTQAWKRPSQCSLRGYQATELYEHLEIKWQNFLGCSPSEFVFTSGTTAGLNFDSTLCWRTIEQRGCGCVECDGTPWTCSLADGGQAKGLELKIVHVDENGRISLTHLEEHF